MGTRKNNLISGEVKPEDKKAALGDLKKHQETFNFGVSLTPAERSAMPSLGDHRTAYVQKCISIAESRPEILPGTFQVDELKKDYQLAKDLEVLAMEAKNLVETLTDNQIVAGAETYKAALMVKKYLEAANDNDPSYDNMVKELEDFFQKAKKEEVIPEEAVIS